EVAEHWLDLGVAGGHEACGREGLSFPANEGGAVANPAGALVPAAYAFQENGMKLAEKLEREGISLPNLLQSMVQRPDIVSHLPGVCGMLHLARLGLEQKELIQARDRAFDAAR